MFAPVVFSEKENEMDSSRIQYDRWLSQPSLDASLRAELSAMADDAHAIDNAFGCELTFGTGGLRGILGAGTNRMNVHVVRPALPGKLPPSLRQMVSKHIFTPASSRCPP